MALKILGRRYVSWGFNVDNLENWLTTLEKLTDDVDFSITHRNDWLALNRLKWELTAAHDLWKKQSQEKTFHTARQGAPSRPRGTSAGSP